LLIQESLVFDWLRIGLAGLVCSSVYPVCAGDVWPEWRGPAGQGISDAVDLPVSWSEDSNVAWKTPVRGRGWSTPVVVDGHVWVTTATHVPAPKAEAEERRKTTTNSMPLTISKSAAMFAVCLDLQSGKIISETELLTESDPQMIHVDNSYATPTPIVEGNHLYCYFGPSGFVCLDRSTTDIVWTNTTLRVLHENGAGSSPVLWKDLLLLHCDGIDMQYIVALDRHTGKEVWKTERTGRLKDNVQMRKSYSTPLVVDVDGKPQVISPSADWVYGYDPTDGRELWKVAYGDLGFSNSARPVAGHGLVYICTGYMQSRLLAIRPGNGSDQPAKLEWEVAKQVPAVSSPLLIGNELYMVGDKGIATCLDAQTGEEIWRARLGKNFWASPLMADGRIHFFDRDSTATVIEPGRTFRKLAVNKLSGEQLATAAAVDGSLLIRTEEAVYCLRSQ
jgi:outer membrane protein assembly factor BamB